jgi:hypothetical protein
VVDKVGHINKEKFISIFCKKCGLRINGWWNKEYIDGDFCEKHINKEFEMKFLFRDNHNGHYVTYQPFEVSGNLQQEEANKIMLKENLSAKRIGSTIDNLLEPLDKANFIVKKYKSIYIKPSEAQPHQEEDKLPDCMYSWPIIECISGNY